MSPRRTRTQYRSPYRPWLVRGANFALAVRPPRLESAELMARAERKTGLSFADDVAFRPGLDQLLAAIEEEARLHPVGRFMYREHLTSVLANRLRTQAWWAATPDLAAMEIASPIVITGLQRTGTTFLQRLLAADPRHRSLASWETLNPVPLHRPDGPLKPSSPSEVARRRKAARTAELALRYLAPDFFAIHPVEVDAPEEESVLMDLSLESPAAEAMLHVPSYAQWLAERDARPVYALLVQVLQALQRQKPGEAWILKTPHHLGHLEILHRALPQARVVVTHRDPAQTLPSFCSMVAHGRGVFSDHVDPDQIGRSWLERQVSMLERADRARESCAGLPVLDVDYRSLVKDPLHTVRQVYAFAGRPFDEQAKSAVENAIRTHRQHKHGRHVYRLEDFGLDPEEVDRRFARYRQAHLAEPATPP